MGTLIVSLIIINALLIIIHVSNKQKTKIY